jgi:uncharacterized protein (TIGR03437 family)
MKRSFLILPFLLLGSGELWGQSTPISTVRVFTSSPGARFLVDGRTYFGSQTFAWPQGSKHVLQFPLRLGPDGVTTLGYQESTDGLTQFAFGGWTTNNGVSLGSAPDITVVADPTLTFYTATVTPSYRVLLRFSSNPVSPPGNCAPPIPQDQVRSGIIIINNICYGSDADVFVPAGILNLQAIPFPGFVFLGWSVGPGAVATASPNIRAIPITGPMTIAAQFTTAKRVRFVTDPAGLDVLVNRTSTPTSTRYNVDFNYTPAPSPCESNLSLPPNPPVTIPALCFGDFDFLPGSTQVIGATSPQYDQRGNMWVFDRFSNGLGDNATYVVPNTLGVTDTLVARFVPGAQAAFLTEPAGLRLSVDGRTNWPSYNFAWGVGSQHTVSAPAEQVDARGRRWVFRRWSNGGAATQTFTVQGPMRWTATYEALPQLTITSNPAGLTLTADGQACRTPCVLDRAAGSQVVLSAPLRIAVSDRVRWDLQGWSDGGEATRTVTFDVETRQIQASYRQAYQLLAVSDPSDGVNWFFDPPTPDGFLLSDQLVTVRADTRDGFRFRRWDGDLSGSFHQGTVFLNGPKTVVALLERVPFIPPAGIRNAAGETPDNLVAPGSLIAITGESLADAFEAGRGNPLAQTIAGVTVWLGERLLPLVFVAPREIRAQLPSDLPDGQYDLRVRRAGSPEVTGVVNVARNAPGLFTVPGREGDTRAWARATRADGSAVNQENPARAGEMITLWGTGFGPYDRPVIDGFPAPSSPEARLADTLEVRSGDVVAQTEWAGAAAGETGLSIARFRVPAAMVAGETVPLVVTVNGRASNTVVLPVR